MAVSRVMVVFTIASILMWVLPIGVLQTFNWNIIPGLEDLSPRARTLWSGALAVLCVNVVIACYIFLALHESTPATEPQPDPIRVGKPISRSLAYRKSRSSAPYFGLLAAAMTGLC
ncbi:hypothetical protein R1flu_010594 [Riccia fluitans]|uniref:Vacuolar ATPase assembly integral membrane protein VMA21 homolog n=1 Tax=Riccia fluitans TaxID=41844 RepID=A0ABD1Z9K6_9MARC